MEITWYGLSCFRLTERGLATVVTDPYDHETAGLSPLKLRSDIITISHDAPGHNFTAGVKGYSHRITGPGEFEIGGVFITGVQTNGHKRAADELRNTLYVFEYEGVNVAHLGDLPDCTVKLAPLSKFLKEMGLGTGEHGKQEAQPSLKVTRSSVPDETKVVVLEHMHEKIGD
jgi:hypothetical protein